MDSNSILDYFDNRIASEIHLPVATDCKLLGPVQYFDVRDTEDLSKPSWNRGGYDEFDLRNL